MASNVATSWKNGVHFGAALGMVWAGLEYAYTGGIFNGMISTGSVSLLAIAPMMLAGAVMGGIAFGLLFASGRMLAENLHGVTKELGLPEKVRETDYGYSVKPKIEADHLTIDQVKASERKKQSPGFVQRLEAERAQRGESLQIE